MQPGLGEIEYDIHKAMDRAITKNYRKKFPYPRLPTIYDGPGKPELEDLALQSPYSILLELNEKGFLQWDFEFFKDFEHCADVRSLSLKVIFEKTTENGLKAIEIQSKEYGTVKRDDMALEDAKALVICAASTHTSFMRHFKYVHLVSGNQWAMTTRNELPTDKLLYRLVWPSLYNSFYTNHEITEVQLLPNGDFVNMFSFTHAGLMNCYDVIHKEYRAILMVPARDWERRGLSDSSIASPSQTDLVQLFYVFPK